MRLKQMPHRSVLAGYGWMSLAVLIWAGWLVLTSSGRLTALSVVDLAWFRAVVPAVFLAPLLWRSRRQVARLGLKQCLLLSAYGAPFTLCVGYGLTMAPVAHAGAMVPGLMPVFALGLGHLFLGHRFSLREGLALLCILAGAGVLLWFGPDVSEGGSVSMGHLLFLAGALCWACFTVTIGQFGVQPFLATAIVAVLSVVVLTPLMAVPGLSHMRVAEVSDVAFQAVFQGFFAGLISLFAFGRALQLVGGRVAALSALTPGVAALMAIPLLGQMQNGAEIAALGLVIGGLFMRSVRARDTSKSGQNTGRD